MQFFVKQKCHKGMNTFFLEKVGFCEDYYTPHLFLSKLIPTSFCDTNRHRTVIQ